MSISAGNAGMNKRLKEVTFQRPRDRKAIFLSMINRKKKRKPECMRGTNALNAARLKITVVIADV